jgi:hypothetical protein
MSLLYPRLCTVKRPGVPAVPAVGQVPFSGVTPQNERLIVANVLCSIIYNRSGGGDPAGLPTDSPLSQWKISIPVAGPIALGLILTNDIVIDDTGLRYKIVAPNWDNNFGYTLYANLLYV